MSSFIKLFQDIIFFSFIPFVIYLTVHSLYLKAKISKVTYANQSILDKYKEKKKLTFALLPFALLALIYLWLIVK